MKKKIISVIVGVAGLTMAYFLASGISHIIYNRPTDNAAAETESTTDSAVQGTEEAKSAMTEDEINEMLAGMKTTETAETETATEEQSEVIPVKFEELQAVNPDVYAWITVPGTDIDYPILQHASDNSYYLMHNIDGSYGYPGCIYTENMNSKDFTDNNTVIYGHNMKNLSMFGKLKYYNRDENYYDSHQYFQILVDGKKYRYQIFSYETVSDDSDEYTVGFEPDETFGKFVQRMAASSMKDTGIVPTKDDKVVTLSTCSTSGETYRFVVHGVRVDEH